LAAEGSTGYWVDLEEAPHVRDCIHELASGPNNERDHFSCEMVHVLAWPHHDDEPLLGERDNVSAG